MSSRKREASGTKRSRNRTRRTPRNERGGPQDSEPPTLRHISLNTTAGLVSPAARRLATPTYRSVELAALVLEGKTFKEATQEAEAAWSGSLEEDHRRALELMQAHRDALQDAMAGLMGPEQFSKDLEIS